MRPRVADIREVYEATRIPVFPPSSCRCHGKVGKRTLADIEAHGVAAAIAGIELQRSRLGGQRYGMCVLLPDAGTLVTFHVDEIYHSVDNPRDECSPSIDRQLGGMLVLCFPVAGVVAVCSRRIREPQHHLDGAVRLNV